MDSSFIRGCSENSAIYYSFDVSVGDSKGGVGPRINQISSHKIIVGLMVEVFVSSHSRDYLAMFNSKKNKYSSSLSMR